MRRLVVLAACLSALGCANAPLAPAVLHANATTPAVDAGPPDCSTLAARIRGSEAADSVQSSGTWLDAPLRMVEGRRLRALHARATRLGCSPRI